MKKQKIISLILAAALLFTSADMTIAARAQENTAAVVLNEAEPTGTPEEMKEEEPALEPTEEPEAIPTATPTAVPEEGQEEATQEPSASPEMTPEPEKTEAPTATPGEEVGPTEDPLCTPSASPGATASPSASPSVSPSASPTATAAMTPQRGQLLEMQADSKGIYQAGSFEVEGAENGNGGIALLSLEENSEESVKEILYQGMLAQKAEIDIYQYQINKSRIQYLVKGILNEHPELYYVTSFSWRYYSNGIVDSVLPAYESGLDDGAFKSAMADALAVVDDSMTDLEKAIALHEYLVLNCEYDYANYLNGTIPGTSYSAYGVLVKRTAVCQGYALAYKYLCNQVGIDCYMVTSTAMNHAWNMIVLGEELYQVDVTWDDPTWDRIGRVSHSYMFLSDEQLTARKHHDWEVTIGSDVVDLTATDTTYDNYFWGNASSQLIRDGSDYYYTDDSTEQLTKYTASDQSTSMVADLGKWYVSGNAGSYWNGVYSGLFRLGDRLYYNTCKEIKSVALDGTDEQVEFQPSAADGHIYGVVYARGRIRYLIATSPNKPQEGTIYEIGLENLRSGGDYEIPVSSILLDHDEITMKKGSQAVLTATLVPSYASGAAMTWTSSNTEVATVENGTVTGVGQGSCVITAAAGGKTAQCTVKVTEKLETPEFIPEAGTFARGESSVTIDRNAKVALTARAGAEIYYSTDGGKTTALYTEPIMISKNMTVSAKAVMEGYEDSEFGSETYIACDNELALSKETVELTEGGSGSLSVTKVPTGRNKEDISWKSSDETVVTCKAGKLSAVKGNDGTAVITASVLDHKGSTVTASCTVTVKPLEYTVTFKDYNGTILEKQTVAARRDAVLPADPERTGYDFTGWNGNYQNINRNETLTAAYAVKTYQITYDLNGGTGGGENPSTYTIKTASIILKSAVGQKGTIFAGWYEEGNTSATTVIKKGSTGDIALKAKWKLEAPEFSISSGKVPEGMLLALTSQKEGTAIYYTLDGTTPVIGKENCHRYETAITLDEAIATEKVVQIKAIAVLEGFENSEVAEAKYTVVVPKRFTVIFQDFDGSEIKNEIVLEGRDAQLPDPNPERTGYDFKGWKGNYQKVEKDEILTAEYTPHEYSITYLLDGGTNNRENPGSYTIESKEIILKEAGNRPGYFFDGWYLDAEYQKALTTIPEGSYGELTVYAKWTGVQSEDGLWIAGIDSQEYTGKPVKPSVQVYNGSTLLEEKKDYTVSYKNNIKVNEDFTSKTVPTVIISGKGNYAGKAQTTFLILPRQIGGEDGQVTAGDVTLKANGREQKPDVKLFADGKLLKKGRDYELSYWQEDQELMSVTEAGSYRIRITGTGNYTGTRWAGLTVTDAKLIGSVSVPRIANQTYTGSAITPALTLKDGSMVLAEGTDYTVRYENNVDPGKANAVITGIGSYAGERSVSFRITGIPMSRVSVSGLQTSFPYTGSEITQSGYALTTSWNGTDRTLAEGVDYTVSYYNNQNAGTASISFVGQGGFQGVLRRTYKINKVEMEAKKDQVEINDLTASSLMEEETQYTADYTKGGAMPEPTIKINGTALTAGVDYTIKYRNNGSTGEKGTMIITGRGGFKGTLKIPFAIRQKDLSGAGQSGITLTAPDKVYRDKKDNYKIAPTLKDSNGKTLKAGVDYDREVKYTYAQTTALANGTIRQAGDPVQAGDILPIGTEVKVTVTGKGNYKGTIESSYRIVEKDIKFATVQIQNQTYRGKAVTLEPSDITIRMGGTKLDPASYEIVSYQNNNRTGIAAVTIRGIGDTYGGTKTIRFYIKPAKVSWWWKNR